VRERFINHPERAQGLEPTPLTWSRLFSFVTPAFR
jgi:hypothetical protein